MHWVGQLQKNTRLSSKEAENVAMSQATQEVVYLRHLVRTLKVEQNRPTPMYDDSEGAKRNATGEGLSERSRHMDIQTSLRAGAAEDKRPSTSSHRG